MQKKEQRWELIIVIPAYNSESSLGELLKRIKEVPKIAKNVSIKKLIIVDDGSKDSTKKILADTKKNFPSLRFLSNQKNSGAAKAILEGLDVANRLIKTKKQALEKTIIVRMDSDLEHQPEDIQKIIFPILAGKANFTIGYIPLDFRNGILNFFLNRYIGEFESKQLLGLQIPQFCPGFYSTRADVFKNIYPILIKKAAKFEKRYGKQMTIIDFVTMEIAKNAGEKIEVVELSPIENKWIKKIPFSKLSRYLDFHNLLMKFIKDERKEGKN